MQRDWKWRIILSSAAVLLSIGMSPSFFNGVLANRPSLWFVTSALNLVPSSILAVLFPYEIGHLYWTRGYWVRFVFWQSQFLVFWFWWWIGWKIDLRSAARDCSRNWTIAEIAVGLGLSFMLFIRRGAGRAYPYGGATPWLMMAWSAVLLMYSLVRLRQLRGAGGQRVQ